MHVFLIAATTLDGFIAQDKNHLSTKWTSKEDFQFFKERTTQAGVLVMGRTTFETIGRALPGRKIIVMSSQPKPEKYSQLNDAQVEYTSETPEKILQKLSAAGRTEVAICGGASVYTQFMQAGLINTLFITVEPVLFGTGITLFNQPISAQLTLNKVHQLSEQTIVLEYKVE